jgi:hypothetical protein
MEDSIILSIQVTPVKSERIPLKERIRGLMYNDRPRRRRKRWLEKIVRKKATTTGAGTGSVPA